MNFNLFDDMNGLILRERENSLDLRRNYSNNMNSSYNANNSSGTSGSSRMNEASGTNGNTTRFPKNTPLAMAYVPFQQWNEVYTEDEAFKNGTLFPELNLPFERGGSSYE